ncbi:MAG: CubicO group peptidase (beta-lactamase class C family) [Alphaproteobacteria bacterium]|jgi:CubicO group peptidase (beta-lactamase class C family)
MIIVFLSLSAIVAIILWLIGPDWRTLVLDPPKDTNVLFWSQSQRDAGFKILDESSLLVESRNIEANSNIRELPTGKSLILKDDMDAFFKQQRLSGALILHKGQIRYERYGIGHSPDKRWTSFSVAKSFTSSLVGIAVKDGDIGSLDDSVSKYILGLQGSVYDNVTIEQLLTMTSGVGWNESYTDPNSDVAKFNFHKAEGDLPTIVSYMRTLSRAHPAGEKWNYSTGETNLIGILVARATGRNISEYLSEKIWQPFGMANKASWLLGADGNEISGCCMQASLQDFARYGLFILEDGAINGVSILPDGWLALATTKRADINKLGAGYGYQWWTFDDGSFTARGIFGQTIFIDPQRELVIAFNGNWPIASDSDLNDKRFAFIDRVRETIDLEE